MADDVRDHEKIVREAEARDEPQLALDARLHLARESAVARARAGQRVFTKPRGGVAWQLREDGGEPQEVEVARLGDAHGFGDGVGHVEEEPAHLLN